MMTIATICARGGSTGLPGKNIMPLFGKPLINYSIEAAQKCKFIDKIYVSTDSQEIAAVAEKAGAIVPFLRPAELATSQAPKLPVIQHLVEWVEKNDRPVNRIVDLDPTSPLREISDIEASFKLLNDQTDLVITAFEAEKNPYFNMVEYDASGNIVLSKPSNTTSRQEAPKVYSMNASVYVWHRHSLKSSLWGQRTKMHIMPRERSIDIDNPIDFKLVEILMREKLGNV